MIIERMETSPLWSCSIQLAEENWATQPSPYKGIVASYEVGVVSPIDTSFCTKFHIETDRASCALWSLALASNNLGIFGGGQSISDIREIIYSGAWYIPPSDDANIGSVELDFSLFMDVVYIPGAHHFRWSQLNGTNSTTYEWDITDGTNHWIPTGIKGEVKQDQWNTFSLQIDVDKDFHFNYHSIEMNGEKHILDWSYAPINIPAHKGWLGAQPNFQLDVLGKPQDIWAKDLKVELTQA